MHRRQTRLQYVERLTYFMTEGTVVSRQLRRLEESEAQLKKALDIHEACGAEATRRYTDVRHGLAEFKPKAHKMLGITYSEVGVGSRWLGWWWMEG